MNSGCRHHTLAINITITHNLLLFIKLRLWLDGGICHAYSRQRHATRPNEKKGARILNKRLLAQIGKGCGPSFRDHTSRVGLILSYVVVGTTQAESK